MLTTVTVVSAPSCSLSRSAASSAYSSYGFITRFIPVRTSRFVAGSIFFSAAVSGTTLTVTAIFIVPPARRIGKSE